jgi:hypothetical protein
LPGHKGVAHRGQLHFVALHPNGDRVWHSGAFDCYFDRFAFFAAHPVHHLLARPFINILVVEGDYPVTVSEPGFVPGCAGSGREDVNVIVSFGDCDADSIDAAALFGLNIVELGFGEKRRVRIELMKHTLYRVLAQTLEVNVAGVVVLDFGERVFEIVGELFGSI